MQGSAVSALQLQDESYEDTREVCHKTEGPRLARIEILDGPRLTRKEIPGTRASINEERNTRERGLD